MLAKKRPPGETNDRFPENVWKCWIMFGTFCFCFVNRFGDAININYRSQGISSINVCPGFTVTEFHTASGMQDAMDKVPAFMKKDSETVAIGAVQAMMKGRSVWIPGALNKLLAFLCNILPTSVVIKMSSSLAGGRYE